MEQTPKTSINTRNIAEIFFYLFLMFLFFPIRYVFLTQFSFKTGAFSDFTSISFYLSDILLIITWLWLILPRGIAKISRGESFLPRGGSKLAYLKGYFQIPNSFFLILILWLILANLWHFSTFSSLNAYYFLKFLEFIVAYETIRTLFRETGLKHRFFQIFIGLTTIQAILALIQFKLQHPLGIYKLGEQLIYPWNQGIAKLVISGTTYIRGYGTFPHPNPLSAFLVAGCLVSIYLLLQAKTKKTQLLYSASLILNILGLTVAFSRAAYLALAIGLVIYFGYLIYKKLLNRSVLRVILTVFAAILISSALFRPFLLTRTTVTDNAALARVFYAKIGWRIVKTNPIFGTGAGVSVLHMEQFSPIRLWPWQIQPIHNYFLLAAAELGIPGALILTWIFLSHLWKLIINIKHKISNSNLQLTAYSLLLIAILVSFLVLMQFDHYFYTLQQTQVLLWIWLGVIAAESFTNKQNVLK